MRSSFGEKYTAVVNMLINSQRKPDDEPGRGPTPPTSTVRLSSVAVQGVPAVLSTTEQVGQYLAALRSSLLAAIAEGKAIVR